MVLLGDFLGAQVFFYGQRIIGATFHRGVVGHDHALVALHPAYAGDHARRRRCRRCTYSVSRQLADFEKWRAGIERLIHPLTRQQFAASFVFRTGCFAALVDGLGDLVAQIGDQGPHGGRVGLKLGRTGVDFRNDLRHDAHQAFSANSSRPMSMRRISEVPAPIS